MSYFVCICVCVRVCMGGGVVGGKDGKFNAPSSSLIPWMMVPRPEMK